MTTCTLDELKEWYRHILNKITAIGYLIHDYKFLTEMRAVVSMDGREYWAQGEFHVDKEGILHHNWITPTGHEIEITTTYREESNIDY